MVDDEKVKRSENISIIKFIQAGDFAFVIDAIRLRTSRPLGRDTVRCLLARHSG